MKYPVFFSPLVVALTLVFLIQRQNWYLFHCVWNSISCTVLDSLPKSNWKGKTYCMKQQEQLHFICNDIYP